MKCGKCKFKINMIRYITMVSDVEDLLIKKKMNSQRFYCSGNHRGGMSAPKSIGC